MTEPASDLAELLSVAGIRLKSQAPGYQSKVVCPRCTGGKTRELSLQVKVDDDGDGATWKCWRGACNWTDGGRVHRADGVARRSPPREAIPPQAPAEHALDITQNRPKALYAFFEKRGISEETVHAFGLYVAKRFFPEIGEQHAIVFPYRFNGKVVNRKYRPPQKNPQLQEKNPLPTLFNIDAITSTDVVNWVEGEPDCMAMHEAGYPQTVTLANGAGSELRDEDDPRREDDKRFRALDTHGDLLAEVKKFIIAGDNDGPGLVLREELARRLGRHRCWLVTWPEGCKDANDCLIQFGKEGVQQAVEAAEPYPIAGMQRVRAGTLLALRHAPPPLVLTTGVMTADRVMKLPGEGRLIVVTGLPSHGKSAWTRWLMVHTMKKHNRRWQVFSPEMQPWEQFAATMAEVLVGVSFWPHATQPLGMSDQQIGEAEEWLRDRCSFLVSDAEDVVPTLDWLLDRARVAVLRDGVTDILTDPWNEVEHDRQGLTETDYTGRSLQRIKAFCLRHGCNWWIVAHPTKLLPPKPGAEIPPPGLYDIAGGANWANKADLGITVHSPTGHPSEIILRKARFSRWGVRNAKALVHFDRTNGRYSSPPTDLYGEPQP